MNVRPALRAHVKRTATPLQPRVNSRLTLTGCRSVACRTRAYPGLMIGRVTPDDVQLVLADVITAVAELPNEAWELPAAGLAWTCRETVAHLLDDLGAYAMQLSGRHGHGDTYTRLVETRFAGPSAPAFLFWPEQDGGTSAIIDCLDAVGGLLVAVVATTPPERRGWHPYGSTDAAGFAAMGITEAALHGWDILHAQDRVFETDDAVIDRVLARIFPTAARTADPWRDLLTATGRYRPHRGHARARVALGLLDVDRAGLYVRPRIPLP